MKMFSCHSRHKRCVQRGAPPQGGQRGEHGERGGRGAGMAARRGPARARLLLHKDAAATPPHPAVAAQVLPEERPRGCHRW